MGTASSSPPPGCWHLADESSRERRSMSFRSSVSGVRIRWSRSILCHAAEILDQGILSSSSAAIRSASPNSRSSSGVSGLGITAAFHPSNATRSSGVNAFLSTTFSIAAMSGFCGKRLKWAKSSSARLMSEAASTHLMRRVTVHSLLFARRSSDAMRPTLSNPEVRQSSSARAAMEARRSASAASIARPASVWRSPLG